jgi:ribosome-binding factor A
MMNRVERRFPRIVRINELLREVIAEELERIDDERLNLMTITGVTVDPDLRHARVWVASLPEEAAEGLAEHRVRLQAAVGRQVHLKYTPELRFLPDPAIAAGDRVEEILRDLHREDVEGKGRSE